MNNNGEIVLNGKILAFKGRNKVSINLSDLAAGSYQMAISNPHGGISHSQFIKK